MKTIFTSFFFGLVATLTAQSLSLYQVDEFKQYETLLDRAQEGQQLLVVIVYQEGGDLEDMIRQGVFADSSLKSAYQKHIPMAVNIESSFGAKMATNIGFKELPAFAFFSPTELLVKLHEGTANSNQLVQAITEAQSNRKQFDKLSGLYLSESQLTKTQWQELIEIYSMNFSFRETQRLVFDYLNSISEDEYLEEPTRGFLLTYAKDLDGHFAQWTLAHHKDLDSAEWVEYQQQLFDHNLERAIANTDTVLLEKITTELLPMMEQDSTLEKLQLETAKDFAVQTNHFRSFSKTVLNYGREMQTEAAKAEYYYDEAFELIEDFNKIPPLNAALEIARASVKAKGLFKNHMLYSYNAYLLEKYELAKTQVETALKLAETSSDQRKAENLLKMIEAELTAEND